MKTNITATKQSAGPVTQPMDMLLFVLTLMLIAVGIVTVFDASYALAFEHRHGDSFYYVKLQAAWAAVGLVVMLVIRRVPYWKWRKVAVIGVGISALLLVAVLIPHVGISVGGARRWVGHGPFRIQPSELAKLTLIIYLAKIASAGPKMMRNLKFGLMPPLCVTAVLAVLIAKEPDLGTAIVTGATGLILLFLAGARRHHMAVVVSIVAVAVSLYAISKPYRLHRLIAFLDPRADQYHTGYQVWHALIALGSGGVTGLGLGEGREKLYIPMARTDFIFPVIAEEWGLIGTLTLVFIFTLVAARGYAIAYRTKDPFGAFLAAGVTTLITVQALINIAVATSSLPNTGVPLPFISYGGSSLVLLMAGIGLLLNVSCHPEGSGKQTAHDRVEPNETDFNRRWDRNPYVPRTEIRTELRTPTTLRRVDRTRPDRSYRD